MTGVRRQLPLLAERRAVLSRPVWIPAPEERGAADERLIAATGLKVAAALSAYLP